MQQRWALYPRSVVPEDLRQRVKWNAWSIMSEITLWQADCLQISVIYSYKLFDGATRSMAEYTELLEKNQQIF